MSALCKIGADRSATIWKPLVGDHAKSCPFGLRPCHANVSAHVVNLSPYTASVGVGDTWGNGGGADQSSVACNECRTPEASEAVRA